MDSHERLRTARMVFQAVLMEIEKETGNIVDNICVHRQETISDAAVIETKITAIEIKWRTKESYFLEMADDPLNLWFKSFK